MSNPKDKNIGLDTFINKIVGFGIPGLVLFSMISGTNFADAAVLFALVLTFVEALTNLGPFGALGELVMLGVIGYVAKKISKFGIGAITKNIVKAKLKKGMSKKDIIEESNNLFISSSLRNKIKKYLNK